MEVQQTNSDHPCTRLLIFTLENEPSTSVLDSLKAGNSPIVCQSIMNKFKLMKQQTVFVI